MEEGVGKALAVLVCLAASAALGQEGPSKWTQDFEKRFPAVSKNAAAEDLESLGLALGFDSRGTDADDRPTKADREARLNAGYGSWLEAQLATSGDSIDAPPPRFVEFLETKQSSLWRAVTLLEKETPEWGFDPHKKRTQLPELLFVAHLHRLLLGAALVEERAGRPAQARELLEAGWSLYQSIAGRPELIFQLVASSAGRTQAGVLRKMSDPGFGWLERMESSESLERMLESIRNDFAISFLQRDGPAGGPESSWARIPQVVADRLEKRSPCDLSKLSSDDLWKPAAEELRRSMNAEDAAGLDVVAGIMLPQLTSALHRAARLVVESELTARILQLRQEKAAARPSRWPQTFYNADSRVCPGAVYEYHSGEGAMSIRFKGAVGDLEAPAKPLPLSFEARAPKPSVTTSPTRRASPKPTPGASLTPGKAGA
jgi:hypothetical protein